MFLLGGASDASVAQAAIKQGDSGAQVAQIQKKLSELKYAINVDGSFGSDTVRLVKYFQESKGLEPDGIVGEATQVALFGHVIEAAGHTRIIGQLSHQDEQGYDHKGVVDCL